MAVLTRRTALLDAAGVALAFGTVLGTTLYARSQPAAVTQRIVRDLVPGAIVLLHEGAAHGHILAIVEAVLQQLQVRGLQARLPSA